MSNTHDTDKGNTCIKDFRQGVKDSENAYIRTILESDTHYQFASNLLLKYIKKYVEYECDLKILIQHLSMKDTDKVVIDNNQNKESIGKIAYKSGDFIITELGRVLSTENRSNYSEFKTYVNEFNDTNFLEKNMRTLIFGHNRITFSQIMGAIYPFQTDNEFTKKCIEDKNNSELKIDFVNKVFDYFSIGKKPDSDLDDNYKLITELLEKKSQSQQTENKTHFGNWFHLWVLTYVNNKNNNLLHNNLINDPDYVRTDNRFFTKQKQYIQEIKKDDVKYNQFPINLSKRNFFLGCNKYTPVENGFWFNLMKENNKQIISGPSSSCVLCYQMAFKIAKVLEETPENKFLLLECILADYYDFFHSISEVLQEYTVDAGFAKYHLGMNDLEYIEDINPSKKRKYPFPPTPPPVRTGGKRHKTKRRHTNNRRKIKHSHRNRHHPIRRTKRSKK